MSTTRGSARRSRLTKAAAAAAAALMAAGIATAAITPARAATADPATSASATANQPLLREGSRGAAVSDWQAALNKLAAKGMPKQGTIAVDGVFGPKTKAATLAFQRWAHITADGIVGSQTRAVAARALSSAALDPNPHLKPVLREGSRGTAVSDWQATLNKLAAVGKPDQATVAVDGIFGPKTKTATLAFQRWAHITADGIVGVNTYTAAAQALG
jgi:peptidoglycan hydrolase-like protein with peptidoglycan-binding domain